MTPQEINETIARELGWKHSIWTVPGAKPESISIWKRDDQERPMVPNYCGQIGRAWEIPARHCVVVGNAFYLEWIDGESVWRAGWRFFDTTTGEWNGPANGHNSDPAMAICLAFLELKKQGGTR